MTLSMLRQAINVPDLVGRGPRESAAELMAVAGLISVTTVATFLRNST